MLQGEHSAILSTFIKLPFVIKIIVWSILEWPFFTGFTVVCMKKFRDRYATYYPILIEIELWENPSVYKELIWIAEFTMPQSHDVATKYNWTWNVQ